MTQTLPPDTTFYMWLGYAVIYGGMLLYVLSLALRRRQLQKDLEVLQELEAEA